MPTFSTPEPISATVEIAMGDVRITAGDRDDTIVEVGPSNGSSEADMRAVEQTRVEFADGRLKVTGPRRRVVGPSKKTGSVHVTIELPTGSQAAVDISLGGLHGAGRLGECRIKTAAGDIRLEDTAAADLNTGIGAIDAERVHGAALCTTGSGSIRVAEIDGTASIKNSNGGTWIGEVRGDLRVKAANGSVSVDHARADVNAATANGDVRVGCVEGGSVHLKTALGRIDVGILAGTAARVDLHTSFGTVHNELDSTDRPDAAENPVDVHARTSAGDIFIRRAKAASA
jgi:hypothetical protein